MLCPTQAFTVAMGVLEQVWINFSCHFSECVRTICTPLLVLQILPDIWLSPDVPACKSALLVLCFCPFVCISAKALLDAFCFGMQHSLVMGRVLFAPSKGHTPVPKHLLLSASMQLISCCHLELPIGTVPATVQRCLASRIIGL